MKLDIKAPVNPNYAATVVRLSKFVDLPNCDNLKAALIFGNSVIVSKDAKEGDFGIFFPVECQLSPEFLGNNNLYRKPEWGNVDPTQKGYFEQHGRIKAVKFRGNKSEGFWIPYTSLAYIGFGNFEVNEGQVFDFIGDHEICRKYVPKTKGLGGSNKQTRSARLEDSIVDGQFRLHYDTENLRRNIHKVSPVNWISITDKWHGTSVVVANVLTKRDLKWYEKLVKFFGIKVQESKYGIVYSSRRVIKDVDGKRKTNLHFYDEDIWGIVAKEVADVIPKGFTLYGEIVGYTPEGKQIQKDYTYGCPVGGHRFLVYRVTYTNEDGKVFELAYPAMLEFCFKNGLEPVRHIWYGQANDLFKLDVENHWNENFLGWLENTFVNDKMCPFNDNVPAEGIVLRIDHLEQSEAYKLKNFAFLERESKELDKGEVDIETEESIPLLEEQ